MGLLRFQVSNRHLLTAEDLDRVYMCRLEDSPWQCRTRWDGDLLVIERAEADSGNVFVPWPVELHGQLMLSTASLMERDQPYVLEVELARGLINDIRNQIAAWQTVGLVVPSEFEQQLAEATARFAAAATSQDQLELAASHAVVTLQLAVSLDRALGECYVTQAIAARRRQTPKLATLLGVNLGATVPNGTTAEHVLSTFNTAVVPVPWKSIESQEGKRDWATTEQQLEWCQQNGLKVCGGPLLQVDPAGIPDWLYLWEGDFDNILTFVLDYVKDVVTRLRGRVHIWHIASRINLGGILELSADQMLRVVATAVDTARKIDAQTPIIVSFDQPWAEYMAKQELDFSPLGLADTLIRADLGIAGVGLEINAGYHPGGSNYRTLLAYSQQIDQWSMLGVPLLISLLAPSSDTDDALASGPGQPISNENTGEITGDRQRDWVNRHVPLLLSKNCVQAVLWNQLSDNQPHEFPHGGLFDESGTAKPALAALRETREEYLR